ncbi:acetoacetyl-CoA synthase [Saccharata proteae CBS 121410]|uniref:Acetoacetyl-CoA synthase n=1 Tax=Saccharata proteae CBS 121410 TaxID=1314787 RepID=A0A9P4I0C7_9PEZI|nr:acetoacetyl-CoA synthase [Saccharata proteae CBS 121410]
MGRMAWAQLWEHPDPKGTNLWRFMRQVERGRGVDMKSFEELWQWSVTKRAEFYQDLWEAAQLIHEGNYDKVVDESARMDSVPPWFAGIRLNFAENLLYTRSSSSPAETSTLDKGDTKIAITGVREGASEIRHVTWRSLRRRVGRLSCAMRARGLKKGDRVALVASHSVETLVVFLASTAIGALFSSSSTDMGTKGVLDRLLQIRPKWVFVDDIAVYNGKTTDLRSKNKELVLGLECTREFEGIVVQSRFDTESDVGGLPRSETLETFEKAAQGNDRLVFERIQFSDPFLVVYSSGTTGTPKCIVHSVGGVLINAMKEGKLHRDLGADTVGLQYTTTGWIMYLTSVLTLLYGGRTVLYDGSPFQPDLTTFIHLLSSEAVTNLGISPRYLSELQKHSIAPRTVADLSMVLSDALFGWFYDTGFPAHVYLENISGGTDIAGCFGMGNPLQPVYVGGCQGAALGIKVEIFDSTAEGHKRIQGKPVSDGTCGDLVATEAFPNMPVSFWGDEGGKRYFDAYFSRFDNVWTHGDFVMRHPKTRQLLFLGRADGVLNLSGVRFGSAEIYSVIEGHFSSQIADSICVGQRRPLDADESVMLFLLMAEGRRFTKRLANEVKERIGQELSKRHVPKWVFETKEIPTTVNLKKVELPVKQIVSGQFIKPSGTLLNPDSLNFYYQFAQVEQLEERESLSKARL